MADPRIVLCGGLPAEVVRKSGKTVNPIRLRIGRKGSDVHLRMASLATSLQSRPTDVCVDLLELAAYVYVADQVATRGGTVAFDYGDRWRRTFQFHVPVRCPDVWNRSDVRTVLQELLGFLTGDDYQFRFVRHPQPPDLAQHLTDGAEDPPNPVSGIDEVALFSGGLDSTCGVAEAILAGHRRVVLVSHRPVNQIYSRQRTIVRAIRQKLPRPDLLPLHIALEVNKGKRLNREFTQRSRSFLFAATAAVVARVFGHRSIRFYENGVTGFNLPVSAELLGGRASRTTHPRTLAGFARLFSLLFEGPFAVENPYLWSTKAEVLRRLKTNGHADLAALTCSCVHTWGRTESQPHCGRCSQCVDRRLSALAAGYSDAEDPGQGYESDVLTGARDGVDLTYAERYAALAFDLEDIDHPLEFAARFPELNHALPFTGLSTSESIERAFALYKRHAAGVAGVLTQTVAERAEVIVRQDFPARSLLGVVVGRVPTPPVAETRVARTPGSGRSGCFEIAPEHYEARFAGATCFLGHTMEFRLATCLAATQGKYVSYATLRRDVWNDERIDKNTIQRAASNLRRRLRENPAFEPVTIDGGQRESYRLVVAPFCDE